MGSQGARRVIQSKDLKRFAEVSDDALHVKVVSGGGGGGGDVNIAEVGGVAVGGSSVPINDAGGSITVDGTVTIQEPLTVDQATHDSLNANVTVQQQDADVTDTAPLAVKIGSGDGSGDLALVTVEGASSRESLNTVSPYKVDDPQGPHSVWPIGVVRVDTLATLGPVDGDYVHARTNNRGALWIKPDGDVSIDDGGNVISVDDGGSTLSIDDGGGSITVDGTVTATLPDPVPVRQYRADLIQTGELFRADIRTSVSAGASLFFLIETGNSCTHVRFLGNAQRITNWSLYSGPTHAGTINNTATDKNFCEANTPNLNYATELTVSNDGTLIFQDFSGQAAGAQRYLFGEGEIVLEANTKYLLKCFNGATAASIMAVAVEFWEE